MKLKIKDMNDNIDKELECGDVFGEYTKDCYRLTRDEADHLMKFRIKEECNRVQDKVQEKFKDKIFRQVNRTKDGWKVKLIFYNCNCRNYLGISWVRVDESSWRWSFDKKNWKVKAEKFFSKLD